MALGFVAGSTALLLNVPLLLPVLAVVFVIEAGSVLIQVPSKRFRGKKIFLSTGEIDDRWSLYEIRSRR